MNKPFIIDAHLDLSMNALEWNRDLREPLKEIKLNYIKKYNIKNLIKKK